MCGITGYWNRQQAPDADVISYMTTVLHHRGPDDQGIWLDKDSGIALGHRRLSILDLTTSGSQPMLSHDQRYVIVFNGEIYNHLDIRDILAKKGHDISWKGHSDTETLVNAIAALGIDKTLSACTGMFAFALWDRQEKKLCLARDRIGEKPLYYGRLGNTFVFASELKALRQHPDFKQPVNREALTLFLRHNYIPAPYTIYENIKKLLPGYFLEICYDNNEEQLTQYWSCRDIVEAGLSNPFTGTDDEALTTLHELLSRSISEQRLSDVPLGAFLSGGIDSSMIVALMQEQSSQPVRTFSIGFHEQEYNEAHHAKSVAEHLGTSHTELYVTADEARAVIPDLSSIYDEPFADSSQIPTTIVSRLARQHVTVCLSGDAGDELFGGYNRYLYAVTIWRHCSSGLPGPFRAALAAILTGLSRTNLELFFQKLWWLLPEQYRFKNLRNKLQKLAELFSMETPEEVYLTLLSHWQQPTDIVVKGHEPGTVLTTPGNWPDIPDFQSRMMYLDMISYLPDDILVKVDRAAMSCSLETRVPFLDHRLVDFAWRLPQQMKIDGNTGKVILRKLLYQYVPETLIDRPKMGFGVPIDHWIRGPIREWAETLLDENRLRQQGYFNPAPVQEKLKEHLSGKNNWQYLLWDILMFQSWLET